MDNFSLLTTSNLVIHSLEIFTSSLAIQGNATGPFGRASDLVNRKDRDHIILQEARVTPLGRQPNPAPLTTPLIVARQHVHLVALAPQSDAEATGGLTSGTLASGGLSSGGLTSGTLASGTLASGGLAGRFRESGVRKYPVPGYILTDVYVVVCQCHLIEGGTLEGLLDVSDLFIATTNAAIYINSAPAAPLQRDLVIINKEKIQAMYLAPSPTTPGTSTRRLDEPPNPPTSPPEDSQS
jgi:hypothetical protein